MQHDDEQRRTDPTSTEADQDETLPDVPDAGDGSQPIVPPDPIDISTATLIADAALAAGTLNDDDDRTLYERTLDAREASGDPTTPDLSAPVANAPAHRARIYDSHK